MNKERPKKRKIFTVLLTILAVLAVTVTGVFLYLTPDSAAKAQFKEEASKMTQEITDKNLSKLNTAVMENIPDATGSLNGAEDPDAQSQQGAGSSDNAAGSVGTIGTLSDEEKKVLADKLTYTYDQIMVDMQDDAMLLVNKLIDQAKTDYKNLKSEKKNNPASISKLAVEYMKKGEAMEVEMDSSFQVIVGAMREQMVAVGIDPEPIIGSYEENYAQIKEQRQKTLIDKALKAIKS